MARRFDEFRTVHYELEEDGKKVSCTADILDLPRLYAEHEECRLLPSDKVGELALLLHASPLLVMDQLRACADALNDIGRLSQRDSQEKLSSAVAAVEKRLALSPDDCFTAIPRSIRCVAPELPPAASPDVITGFNCAV